MTAGAAAEALRRGAVELQLSLTEAQQQAMLDYLGLLKQWNRAYNLTAVRDDREMVTQHLLDCLAVVGPLERQASGPQRILDVGSGGGLPGVVLSVMRPDVEVICVDTVGKKAAFVQQVAGVLGLRNLRTEHARVEALPAAEPFSLITARAFASLPNLTRWTQHLMAPSGQWMAMKGRDPTEERAALQEGVEVFHVEQLHVPGLNAERCLVWMRKAAS